MTSSPRTVAIVVTYKPDHASLATALRALCPQIDGLVLVDNGSGADSMVALDHLVSDWTENLPKQTLFQPENRGLGQAQNAGVNLARRLGAEAVLLMDQDSLPAPDMVARQHAALADRQAQGAKPAAIGVQYHEPDRPTPDPLPAGADPVPRVDSLIASGSLIPLDVLDTVGPFDEGLFVDFVDLEWCWRARAAGFTCFAARNAHMQHHIGGKPLRVLGRNMAVHDPVRGYYQMRNSLLLLRSADVPKGWALRQSLRFFLRGLALGLLAPPRRARLGLMARGLWHGWLGQSGKLPILASPTE